VTLGLRTLHNSALVIGARLVSKVLVFVVVILVIRSTGVNGYGQFTALVVYATIVGMVVDLGLRPLFTRDVARDRRLLTPYLNSILSLKVVLLLPALAILAGALALGLPALTPYVWPAFALLAASSFANQLRATFYAIGRLRYEAISIVGESIVLLLAATLMVLLRLPWWSFLWAYALSYTFTTVYAAVVAVTRLGHTFRFDLDSRRLAALGRQSLPFGLTFVISTLYFRIDVPILQAFAGFAAVGLYSAAYKFVDAIAFIPQAMMDPVFPALATLSHRDPDELAAAALKSLKMLAAVGLPLSAAFIVLAAPIIDFTIPRFGAAVPVLRVLGVGAFLLFANNAFIYTLNAMGRQRDATRLAAISLVLNVALNLILIPLPNHLIGGYMGAAWATILTEAGLFAGGWYILRRRLGDLPVVATVRGVVPAGIATGLVMWAVVATVPNPWIAFVLAAVLGVAVYLGGLLLLRAFSQDELDLARETARGLLRRSA